MGKKKKAASSLPLLFMVWMGGAVSLAWQSQGSGTDGTFPNVQVTHSGNYEESALAVNPANPRNLLGIAMFADSSAEVSQPATFSSLDGGATWHENGPLPLPKGFDKGVDPSVTFSSHGRGFLCYRLDGAGEVGTRPQGIFVWRTDDGGHTFSAPQPAFITNGSSVIDHPWIAAGKSRAGADTFYVVWTMEADGKSTTAFSRSDGGAFGPPSRVGDPNDKTPTSPVIAAGPDDRVHVVYMSLPNGQKPGSPREIEFVSSSDGGRHFDNPKIVGTTPTIAGSTARLPTNPALAVDPQTDAVYIAYAQSRRATQQTDIAFVYSLDHGRKWSQPSPIDEPASDAETGYFQPSVAVGPKGIVCVSYYQVVNVSRDLNQSLMNEYLSCSTDHGVVFGPALRITSEPFKYGLGNRFTFRGVELSSFGDYQGLAASQSAIHLLWSDSRPGQPAMFTATVPIQRLEETHAPKSTIGKNE